jgi:hypothetical protein
LRGRIEGDRPGGKSKLRSGQGKDGVGSEREA